MKLGKVDIDFHYERWGSWAIGFWIYLDWFGLQLLMFKVIIQKHIDWDIERTKFPNYNKEVG